MVKKNKLSNEHPKELSLKKYKNFKSIDKSLFKSLISDSFDKHLLNEYFSYVNPNLVIIAKDKGCKEYIGTIVLEKINKKIGYVDKIAVAKKYQGNGVGKKMLNTLDESSKHLVWRAKESNPINTFYKKECDGMQKVGGWIIYWKGLNYDEIHEGIKYAISKKETLGKI